MGRSPRSATGNMVYHVINRANQRARIFNKEKDYEAFENVLLEAKENYPMRILSYCIMPNHWHFVLYPQNGKDLSRFMQWITLTHTQRWHAHHNSIGYGHLYQGRFKSFPVQKDEHFLQVMRYVERNALRANLASRAQDWRWSSAWVREYGSPEQKQILSPWPVVKPDDYETWLNATQPHEEEQLMDIRTAVNRGNPYGKESWVDKTIKRLGLESTVRPRGRPWPK